MSDKADLQSDHEKQEWPGAVREDPKEQPKISLTEAARRARGTLEPPSIPIKFDGAEPQQASTEPSPVSYAAHERVVLSVIDERDAAEEALSQAYFLIRGESPEWSNLFGHSEALEEIDDAQKCLRAEINSQKDTINDYAAEVDTLKQSLEDCVKALANVKKELQASGNWDARDYGWPSNRKAIDAALAAARALTEGR